MIPDLYLSILESIMKAWRSRRRGARLAITLAFAAAAAALTVLVLSNTLGVFNGKTGESVASALGVAAAILGLGVAVYQNLQERQKREEKIASVEERVREHPEKPQFAWDLARTKLENYLDRNLAQVRSIYWLTLLVMASGFGLVFYGLYQAYHGEDKLPVSIVASASGVLISFIGGSFLLIYRSILAQSKHYVTVLERINAVGMAVQVIANIPDTEGNLKNQTTAELAKQLLNLYALSTPTRPQAED